MPTYVARVRDSKGNARKEKIVAASPFIARSSLRERGLVIQDLKQALLAKKDPIKSSTSQ